MNPHQTIVPAFYKCVLDKGYTLIAYPCFFIHVFIFFAKFGIQQKVLPILFKLETALLKSLFLALFYHSGDISVRGEKEGRSEANQIKTFRVPGFLKRRRLDRLKKNPTTERSKDSIMKKVATIWT